MQRQVNGLRFIDAQRLARRFAVLCNAGRAVRASAIWSRCPAVIGIPDLDFSRYPGSAPVMLFRLCSFMSAA
jgi:hypothetical protein